MDVPILGQRGPVAQRRPEYSHSDAHNQSDIAHADLYDSEVIQVEKVLQRLMQRSESRRDYDAFDREIRQRFEEIGFVVKISWWSTTMDDVYSPKIEVVGRTEKHEFDHDQMVHEVTNDILDIGQGGVIKSEDFLKPEPHKH
jgi:hypothetical protein